MTRHIRRRSKRPNARRTLVIVAEGDKLIKPRVKRAEGMEPLGMEACYLRPSNIYASVARLQRAGILPIGS
jgi:hypothetical protein